ncbi:MAG: LysM peptidoglycan-binding domain-containing protein [Rikenellaceae bacterium MAG02]
MKKINQLFCILMIFIIKFSILNAQQIIISTEIIEENGKNFYIHTVEAGQTVYSIAKAYNVSLDDVYKHNEWAKEKIKPGEKLKIPIIKTETTPKAVQYDTVFHIVKPKETLYSISKEYNVDIEDLRDWNKEILASGVLKVNDKIIVGFTEKKLTIPDDIQQISKDVSTNIINYKVKEGETLYYIAKQFNTSIDSIVKWNKLPSHFVKSGQILTLKLPIEDLNKKKCKKGHLPDKVKIIAFVPAIDEVTSEMEMSSTNIAINYLEGYEFLQFYEALLLLQNLPIDYVTTFEIIPVAQVKNKKEFEKNLAKVNWQDVDIVLGPLDDQFLSYTLPFISDKFLWLHYLQKVDVDNAIPEVQFLSNITEEMKRIAEYITNNVKREAPIYIFHTADTIEKYNARLLKQLLNKNGFNNVNFSNTISSLPSGLRDQTVVVALTLDEPTAGNIIRHLGTSIKDLSLLEFFCPSSWLYFDNLDFYFFNKISPYLFFNNCYLDRKNKEIANFVNEFINSYNTFPSIYAIYAYETMNFLNELIGEYGDNYKNCLTSYDYRGTICNCKFVKNGNAFANNAVKIGKMKDYKIEIIY